MPNHVTHTMTVTGPPAAVELFVGMHLLYDKKLEDKKDYWKINGEAPTPRFLDFNSVIPMPKVLDGIVSGSMTDDAVEAVTGKTIPELILEKNPHDDHAKSSLRIKQMFRTDPQREAERKKHQENLPASELEMAMKVLAAIEETGYPTWYEWSIANWGTKWNSYDLSILEESPGKLVCRFDTAWSPPCPIFEKLAEMHPELAFDIWGFDEGWGFCIHAHCQPGQTFEFDDEETNDENHEKAYGYRPERDDEANEQIIEAVVAPKETDEEPDPLGAPSSAVIEPARNRSISLDDEEEE